MPYRVSKSVLWGSSNRGSKNWPLKKHVVVPDFLIFYDPKYTVLTGSTPLKPEVAKNGYSMHVQTES